MVVHSKTEETPTVAFIMPTLNAEQHVEDCLISIVRQKYPKHKMEIIICDGGSSDSTLEIAKKYDCKVIYNPEHRADAGITLGMKASKADVNFVVNADNELPREDWIQLMIKPFVENADVHGVFTRTLKSEGDSTITRYWILLHDHNPLNWFIFRNVIDPNSMKESYGVIKETPCYKIFNFNAQRFPLVYLAQGFGVRRNFIHSIESEFEHVNAVIEMLRRGMKIAYVPDAGMYHYTLENFKHFIRKFHHRIIDRLKTEEHGYRSRIRLMTKRRRKRQSLWFLYSLIPIFPTIDSVKGCLKDRDTAWFYHPLVCFTLSLLILISYIEYKVKDKTVDEVNSRLVATEAKCTRQYFTISEIPST